MSAIVIDCKKIAAETREKLKEKVRSIKESGKAELALATVIVGSNSASIAYVKNVEKTCNMVGIKSIIYEMPYNTKEEELLEIIDELNLNKEVKGILLQIPLPSHIDESNIVERISPLKDVDCLNPISQGKLYRGERCLFPCTPKGIIRILKQTEIDIYGKNAVVIGRSNIVGKPVAFMLLEENATVTICHSKTPDLNSVLMNADIIISAVGKPGLITKEMVRMGAVIIDAGTSYKDNRLVGDVDFDNAIKRASYITSVPGGVGVMTTTMLIENVLEAFENYE